MNYIDKIIDNVINESLQTNELRNHVRKLVSEQVYKYRKSLNESDDNVKNNDGAIKRKAVMAMLKNPKYDHAYLAYQLWHPKDDSEKDTYRSLFSKKATGKPDNDGAIRSFTDEEVTKLYELMTKN